MTTVAGTLRWRDQLNPVHEGKKSLDVFTISFVS
jgi:hypothetical protein